jgi:hypothetical protein
MAILRSTTYVPVGTSVPSLDPRRMKLVRRELRVKPWSSVDETDSYARWGRVKGGDIANIFGLMEVRGVAFHSMALGFKVYIH